MVVSQLCVASANQKNIRFPRKHLVPGIAFKLCHLCVMSRLNRSCYSRSGSSNAHCTHKLIWRVFVCWIKDLSAHSDKCSSIGCRIRSGSGHGRNGHRPGETVLLVGGSLPVHETTGTHPSATDGLQLPGVAGCSHDTGSVRPGLHKALGMRDDVWRGQKGIGCVILKLRFQLTYHLRDKLT